VENPPPDHLQIIVLGPGCARCTQLERDVRESLAEMHLPGELIHVDDFREIIHYGVMGTPALIINGKVVSVGSMPQRQQIKEWLQDAENCLRHNT
jgi:small redox-active disulfide protein 2